MIYHAAPAKFPTPPSTAVSWWAVHAETLTPIRVHIGQGRRVAMDFIIDPAAPPIEYASHPDATFDPAAIADEVMGELTAHIHSSCRLHSTRVISPQKAAPATHLIVFNIKGEAPAIWRSSDPHMILPVEIKTVCFAPAEILAPMPTHFRTAIDLPASGWQYWWDECQDALEELTPQLVAGLK